MKRIIFILCLILVAANSLNAQNFVYQPFIPNQSQKNYQNQQQNSNNQLSEAIRTTAYSVDYNGEIYKMSIKVQLKQSSYSKSYYVTEYYDNSAYGGWTKIQASPTVQKCIRSAINSNSLDNKFMYKALIGTQTYYFDL